MELAFEIIKWLSIALSGVTVTLFVTFCAFWFLTNKRKIAWFGCAVVLLAALWLTITFAKAAIEMRMQPWCASCKQPVSSSYCPDCGWRAQKEASEMVCSDCSTDRDPTSCENCGASMSLED